MPKYSILAIIVASLFWVFDSSVHYLAYGEPEFEWIPGEFNELWMRVTIVILIVCMGIYAQLSANRLLRIEREKLELQKQLNNSLEHRLQLQEKQSELTREAVLDMHNILNNFLNNLILFKLEAQDSKAISDESLKLFDRIIQETATEVRVAGEKAVAKSTHQ